MADDLRPDARPDARPGNVHALPCQPDPQAMAEMCEALFANLHPDEGLIELSWTSTAHPHGLTGGRQFFPDQLDKLVAEAVRLNASPNRNVYVSAGVRKALEDPAVRKRIEDTGSLIVANTPEQFTAQIKAEFEVYKKVVDSAGLKLE